MIISWKKQGVHCAMHELPVTVVLSTIGLKPLANTTNNSTLALNPAGHSACVCQLHCLSGRPSAKDRPSLFGYSLLSFAAGHFKWTAPYKRGNGILRGARLCFGGPCNNDSPVCCPASTPLGWGDVLANHLQGTLRHVRGSRHKGPGIVNR